MKCSDCSRHVRPIVVSDIDGTLAMYHSAVTEFCGNYFDILMPGMQYTGNQPFRDYLGITQEEHRAMKLAYRQGGHKRFVPMYPGADEFMSDLHGQGVEIWVATTRPYNRLDNIDPDTVEWLRRHDIKVDGLLYGEDKYEQLINTVDASRIVACFEDLEDQMFKGQELGLPMYQIDRPHNSHVDCRWPPERRGNFRQAYKFAVDQLATWNGQGVLKVNG